MIPPVPPVDLEPTRVASQIYYWKPMLALFRSVEMAVYRRAGIHLVGPCLDLGGGDGRIMEMLRELDLVEGEGVDLDYSHPDLVEAHATSLYQGCVQADAARLPFADGSFASVVSNNVFSSMPNFDRTALTEVRRVLAPGGVIVATMATDRFMDLLPVPRMLGRVSAAARDRWIRRTNERLPHFHTFSEDGWADHFEAAGLTVEIRQPYFAARTAAAWNTLFLQGFRVFGALRLAGDGWVRDRAADLVGRSLRSVVREELEAGPGSGGPHGYVLLRARRSG